VPRFRSLNIYGGAGFAFCGEWTYFCCNVLSPFLAVRNAASHVLYVTDYIGFS
jgi:hypothetical protein